MESPGQDALDRMEAAMREQVAETGFPGLEIRRAGSLLFARSRRTPEEDLAWRREAVKYRQTLRESMLKLAARLEVDILQFDPFDTIAHVAWINALHDAEKWDEHEFVGNDAYTEFVALLCLMHPLSDFRQATVPEILELDGRSIQAQVKHLFQMSALEDQLAPLESDTPVTALDELRFMTLLHEVAVRYPGSTEHLHEVLRELFEPLTGMLSECVGFSMDQALVLDSSVLERLNHKLGQRIEETCRFERELRKATKRYRQRRRRDGQFDEARLAHLASMRPSDAAREARDIAITWLGLTLGEAMSFTPTNLAAVAKLDTAVARAFLEFHALEFGSVERRYQLPCPTHPLQLRPFMVRTPAAESEAVYTCPVPQGVAWALRPRIEEHLSALPAGGDAAKWLPTYEARRSAYCEQKAFAVLSRLLRPAKGCAHQNVKYRRPVGGDDREFEVDGVLLLDSVLVLLEAKAGHVRPSTRRGGPGSMETDLKLLLGEASEQTYNAWEYLTQTDEPSLQLVDGTTWVIPMQSVREVLRVCVTLEDLTVFATNVHTLAGLGLVTLEPPFWAVSIYDLLVLRDLIELPCVFVHYLACRSRVEKLGCVHGYSELDHLGCYLVGDMPYGSAPADTDVPDKTQIILDPAYSSVIDNWYYYLQGARKSEPRRPARQIPPAFASVLQGLERTRPAGYLETSCLLLDLPDRAQQELAEELSHLRARSNADGARHDVTVIPSGWDLGITIVTSADGSAAELATRLDTYCRLKKYQTQRTRWIGMGSLSWADEPVQVLVLADEPWHQDPEMEELVKCALPPSEPGEVRA